MRFKTNIIVFFFYFKFNILFDFWQKYGKIIMRTKGNMDKENLHEGHRKRMMERFILSPESFQDHEILEIALYPVLKRKNTNEIAHNLLKYFGNLQNVFNADGKELLLVKGVGEAVATEIKMLGELAKRLKLMTVKKEKFVYKDYKERLIKQYGCLNFEKFVVLLLDKNEFIMQASHFDGDKSKAELDILEVTRIAVLNKAYYVVLIHNHPSGNKFPSEKDDASTYRIKESLKNCGIILCDHIIVTKNDAYSYYHENRLEKLGDKYGKS